MKGLLEHERRVTLFIFLGAFRSDILHTHLYCAVNLHTFWIFCTSAYCKVHTRRNLFKRMPILTFCYLEFISPHSLVCVGGGLAASSHRQSTLKAMWCATRFMIFFKQLLEEDNMIDWDLRWFKRCILQLKACKNLMQLLCPGPGPRQGGISRLCLHSLR